MSRFPYAVALEPQGAVLQDRAAALETDEGLVIAVADGAGGAGASERAAEALLRAVRELVEQGAALDSEAVWTELLVATDARIERAEVWGQTTAVVLAVAGGFVTGASVGDSEAWLATADGFQTLTDQQRRKPLLGSGAAVPVAFRRRHSECVLIAGSDGLFKYAPVWKICQAAVNASPADACARLIDLVRLPSGRLQDDVGVVVCALGTPAQADDH